MNLGMVNLPLPYYQDEVPLSKVLEPKLFQQQTTDETVVVQAGFRELKV